MKALQVCRHHDLVADDAGQIGTALFAHWPTVMDHAGTLTAVATTASGHRFMAARCHHGRRTNVWRKVTSPAWRAKRLRSGRRRSTAASSGRSSAGFTDGTDDRAGHDQMVQCGVDGLAATADAMGRAQDRAPDRGLAEARRTTPSGRHEEARFHTLEHGAGQPAGRKRSGVDVDPIR
jgi:hypothetical protein